MTSQSTSSSARSARSTGDDILSAIGFLVATPIILFILMEFLLAVVLVTPVWLLVWARNRWHDGRV